MALFKLLGFCFDSESSSLAIFSFFIIWTGKLLKKWKILWVSTVKKGIQFYYTTS